MDKSMQKTINPTIIGEIFVPNGVSEAARNVYQAFSAVGKKVNVFNLSSINFDAAYTNIQQDLTTCLSELNIFCINGISAETVLATFQKEIPQESYNIICPFWELSLYPEEWARQVNRFDEVWAASTFIKNAIEPTVSCPVTLMPTPCEVGLTSFLGRRYFGIPESKYAFLFFFDLASYMSRKNPYALIECFLRLVSARPQEQVVLVIKLNHSHLATEAVQTLKTELAKYQDYIAVIDKTITDNEIKNLLRCCDCFVSLHRSEGYGRGIAEAMSLGKPVIATGYSGNMEFMNDNNSFPIDYKEIAVKPDEYLFAEGQVWADPDLDQAIYYMKLLLDNPEIGWEKGARARIKMQTEFSYRSMGLKYIERIKSINPNYFIQDRES